MTFVFWSASILIAFSTYSYLPKPESSVEFEAIVAFYSAVAIGAAGIDFATSSSGLIAFASTFETTGSVTTLSSSSIFLVTGASGLITF
jgi:hypothetical protein